MGGRIVCSYPGVGRGGGVTSTSSTSSGSIGSQPGRRQSWDVRAGHKAQARHQSPRVAWRHVLHGVSWKGPG